MIKKRELRLPFYYKYSYLKEYIMTNFYNKKQDTSSDNIAKAAEFLNKKPARQGSNQQTSEVVKPTEKKSK